MIRYVVRKLAARPLTSLALASIVRSPLRPCAANLAEPSPARRLPLEKRNHPPAGPVRFFVCAKPRNSAQKCTCDPPALSEGAEILTPQTTQPLTHSRCPLQPDEFVFSPVQTEELVHKNAQGQKARPYRTHSITPTNYSYLDRIGFESQIPEQLACPVALRRLPCHSRASPCIRGPMFLASFRNPTQRTSPTDVS